MHTSNCKNWNFSGLRLVYLIGLILLPISNTYAQIEESSDIIIYGDERLYIDTAEHLTVHGSLTGIDGATIENQGNLIFNANGDYQSISNYSSAGFFTGMGNYLFSGDGDMYVGGDFPNIFYNVDLEKTSQGILMLENDLRIENRLSLNTGRVFTGDQYKLVMENVVGESLQHDIMSRNAFVFGTFRRHLQGGQVYQFPVGLSDTYFPLTVDNSMQGVEYLDVSFRDDVALEGSANEQLGPYNFGELNQTGSWLINGNKKASEGAMNISAYIFDFMEYGRLETNMFGLVYHPNPKGLDDEWEIEGQFDLPGMPSRREGSVITNLVGAKNYGAYTLSIGDITKLINFISPGEGRETIFIIPGAVDDNIRGWKKRYDETELVVYNSMGREIYKKKPYQNDLDMKDYRDGTYYYIFRYVRNGKPGTIQSYIDVKRIY